MESWFVWTSRARPGRAADGGGFGDVGGVHVWYATGTGVTLTQHMLATQRRHPEATGQFSSLVTEIGVAGKLIAAQVRRAGLIEIWGATGETNVSGDRVQKLDRIAQDTIVEVLRRSGCVAAMASEEEHQVIEVPRDDAGDYVVVFDPLDGSSNIDVNVSIGTIFGIFRRKDPTEVLRSDVLRPGREMVAAGYLIYGSSTAMVLAVPGKVDLFTLDPASGEFFLTVPDLKMPERTKILSINECNEPYWAPWVRPWVDSIKARNDRDKRRVNARHIGSLVADFHRNLVQGGIFAYPRNALTGRGKLRLLYECNPLAYVAEQAGGMAVTDDGRRVLDVEPVELHERIGYIVGPKTEVEGAVRFIEQYA